MLSHFLCDSSKTNTREIVDREPRVLRIVHREHIPAATLHFRIPESLHNRFETHCLLHLLQQQLDKDTTATRGFVFVHLDSLEYNP